jgi:hypothetical protein
MGVLNPDLSMEVDSADDYNGEALAAVWAVDSYLRAETNGEIRSSSLHRYDVRAFVMHWPIK